MNNSDKIQYLLEEVITLPSQPVILARINDLINDPDCSLSEVAKVITSDPGIAFKALRLVNSAHYGLRNQIVSVEHAVMLLGLKVIRNLVVSASVFEHFNENTELLLRHSLACAIALRTVSESIEGDLPQSDDLFVYGLLHDIGKLFLAEFMPEETAKATALCREAHIAPYEAEQRVIGCDHAELGARLAMKWMLPDSLIQAIAGHHQPHRADESSRRIAGMLGMGDFICWQCGIPSAEGAVSPPDDSIWEAASLTSAAIPPLLERFFTALPELDELSEIAK
jgi:putative nucleotidyltransferase with HDIG domain